MHSFKGNAMPKKKEKAFVRTTARAYIDKIAPNHSRNSCTPDSAFDVVTETIDMNAMYKEGDGGGCLRCTLWNVHNLALKNEPAPEEDDE
jgi:hypothetical protein